MGLGEVILFWGWELSQGVFFWVAWEGEVWLFLEVTRLSFFCFSRNYFFGGVGRGGWRKEVGIFSFSPFFLSSYGDLMKIYFQENILYKSITFFWAWKFFNTKILF